MRLTPERRLKLDEELSTHTPPTDTWAVHNLRDALDTIDALEREMQLERAALLRQAANICFYPSTAGTVAAPQCAEAILAIPTDQSALDRHDAELLAPISDFKPNSKHINALPEPLRKYIHDLETRCDPSGDVQTIASLKDQRDALEAEVAELLAETAAVLERAADAAWLIERGELCLGFCDYKFTWVTFTNEQALRFSRKVDAYAFVESMKGQSKAWGKNLEGVKITEHSWPTTIATDQSALDRHDAELLSTVIGNVFPQTPGGYISRTEARAETAALLELAADLCKSVVKAGYREGWNIERDIRALIPADATAAFRERIAEAEQAGKDWEYKHHHDPEHDCCVECQLREYKLAEQQDNLWKVALGYIPKPDDSIQYIHKLVRCAPLLNDIRMGLKDAHETEMAECIQQAVREEAEWWADNIEYPESYGKLVEERLAKLCAAAGAPPAARTGSFLPCTWMAYARGGMGWCSCGNLGTEKEMVPYAAWDKHVSDNPNRAATGALEGTKLP